MCTRRAACPGRPWRWRTPPLPSSPRTCARRPRRIRCARAPTRTSPGRRRGRTGTSWRARRRRRARRARFCRRSNRGVPRRSGDRRNASAREGRRGRRPPPRNRPLRRRAAVRWEAACERSRPPERRRRLRSARSARWACRPPPSHPTNRCRRPSLPCIYRGARRCVGTNSRPSAAKEERLRKRQLGRFLPNAHSHDVLFRIHLQTAPL